MVVVVFRSKLRSEHEREYRVVAERMLELARQAPGFVSFKSFAAEDGERVSLIEFESRDAAHKWGDHAEHRDAQKLGPCAPGATIVCCATQPFSMRATSMIFLRRSAVSTSPSR